MITHNRKWLRELSPIHYKNRINREMKKRVIIVLFKFIFNNILFNNFA